MPAQIPQKILKHWRSGRKIDAIKQLREQSGLGLKEARDLLEASDGPDFVHQGAARQTQASRPVRDPRDPAGTVPLSALSSIKTTTTTVNGKTTTRVTVSGDHAEAIEALMSGANAVPAEIRAEVEDAMARGNKIEAIKLLRDATGLGLAQAKDHIDAAMDGIALDWQILQRQSVRASAPNHFQPGAPSPGEVPRGQGRYLWLLVLALAAVGLWYYFNMPWSL
ncbi:ribosomal protein L7/L12 [Comamonas testosteroni]|uniref:ribosomal protein L7/L12 n=1 Tax=Comamonas testosteroni TaxID=285 RepID=UPI0025CD6EE1|nr:ribosomal protein L7/L12 [Comamonas testosteroni]MEB5965154.1 ribosomal protein L7/L12 [Comamonas testosteroni]